MLWRQIRNQIIEAVGGWRCGLNVPVASKARKQFPCAACGPSARSEQILENSKATQVTRPRLLPFSPHLAPIFGAASTSESAPGNCRQRLSCGSDLRDFYLQQLGFCSPTGSATCAANKLPDIDRFCSNKSQSRRRRNLQ